MHPSMKPLKFFGLFNNLNLHETIENVNFFGFWEDHIIILSILFNFFFSFTLLQKKKKMMEVVLLPSSSPTSPAEGMVPIFLRYF
jgi:hypothetical protein